MKFSNKFLVVANLALLAACTREPQEHFEFGLLENPLFKNLTVNSKEESTIQATSAADGSILKAKEYEGGEQQFSNLKTKIDFSVKTAFGNIPAGYPGVVSRIVDCDPSLLPKRIENPATGASGFLTKTNSRLSFGVCDRNEIKFDLIYFSMKCGQRLYEIKAYLPAPGKNEKDLENLFRAFQCRS